MIAVKLVTVIAVILMVLPPVGLAQQVTQGVVTTAPAPAPPPDVQTQQQVPGASADDDGGGTPWAAILVAVGLVGAAGGLGGWLWTRRNTTQVVQP